MRKAIAWVLASLCLLLACNGPKDSCEGSARSFFSYLKGHDWDEMYRMLIPDHRRRFSTATFNKTMESMWQGSKGFEVQFNSVSETTTRICIVNGTMSYSVKLSGQQSKDHDDEYFSWTFRKLPDGLWYAEAPGFEKLQGF